MAESKTITRLGREPKRPREAGQGRATMAGFRASNGQVAQAFSKRHNVAHCLGARPDNTKPYRIETYGIVRYAPITGRVSLQSSASGGNQRTPDKEIDCLLTFLFPLKDRTLPDARWIDTSIPRTPSLFVVSLPPPSSFPPQNRIGLETKDFLLSQCAI